MRSRTPRLWWYLLPFLFFPTAPIQAAEPCAGATARFFMAKGDIQIIRSGQPQWQPVGLQAPLCEGDRLRVGKSGSAAVVLPDRSQIRLSPRTVVSLAGIDPEKPVWVNMIEGFLHFFSHKPRKLTITTPIANAGPEGTEFVLGLTPKKASLWVFDGHVRFSNPAGSVLVESGEQAEAETGKVPQKRIIVRPRDAVEWALYYPPLIDTRKAPQMAGPDH